METSKPAQLSNPTLDELETPPLSLGQLTSEEIEAGKVDPLRGLAGPIAQRLKRI